MTLHVSWTPKKVYRLPLTLGNNLIQNTLSGTNFKSLNTQYVISIMPLYSS